MIQVQFQKYYIHHFNRKQIQQTFQNQRNKMKPCHSVQLKNDHCKSVQLWKKISKAQQQSTPDIDCNKSQRFETSLDLQFITQQLPPQNVKLEPRSRNEKNLLIKQDLKSKSVIESSFQIPLSASKINLAQSVYKVDTMDETDNLLENKVCWRCFAGLQQKLSKLKQQIQLICLDHKIMEEQIKLDIKNCLTFVSDVTSKFTMLFKFAKLQYQNKVPAFFQGVLEGKKNVNQKKQYLVGEMNKNKDLIKNHQKAIQQAERQLKLLKKNYDNLQLYLKFDRLQRRWSTNAGNYFQIKSGRNIVERQASIGEISEKEYLSNSSRMQKQQSIEIQNVKMKIQGLKDKLIKSKSKYY